MGPGEDDLTDSVSDGAPVEPAPEPAPLRPDDPVPRFRTDLQVGRGASPGLFQVSDPARDRAFTLYDFELSMARMLDGQRRAAEVVAAGARLGIPVDLPGLDKFVRQLWRYGFLAAPGTPPPAGATGGARPAREAWDEETRTLFQTGLRLMRQGRPGDAAGYFEAILDGHPGNPEVAELLAQAQRGLGLPTRPVGEASAAVATPATTTPGARRRVGLLVAGLAVLAVIGGAAVVLRPGSRPATPLRPAPVATPQAAPATMPPAASPPAPAPVPAPPPAWRDAAVTGRAPLVLAELAAPAAGVVAWSTRDGATVAAGAPLGTLRSETAVAAPPSAAQQQKLAELAELARQDPVYEDFLERERAKVRGATRAVVKPTPLLAPAAGRLERLAADRQRAARGAPLARLLDPEALVVTAALDGAPPEGVACEVIGDEPSQRAPCRLTEPPPGEAAAPGALRALVRRAEAPWLAEARAPLLRLTPAAPPAPATPPPAATSPAQEPRP